VYSLASLQEWQVSEWIGNAVCSCMPCPEEALKPAVVMGNQESTPNGLLSGLAPRSEALL